MNNNSNNHSYVNSKMIPFSFILEEDEKQALLRNINPLKFSRKSVIFRQNAKVTHLMFVKSGLIKTFNKGSNDRSVILNILKDGDYINLGSIFGERNFTFSATAISDTDICEIDLKVFKNIVFKNNRYTEQLFQLLYNENLYLQERLINLVHKKISGKVADVLLFFSEEIYKSKSFTFPVSRKDLADIAGISKENFSRALSELKNERVIELDRSKVEIKCLDILKTLSLPW